MRLDPAAVRPRSYVRLDWQSAAASIHPPVTATRVSQAQRYLGYSTPCNLVQCLAALAQRRPAQGQSQQAEQAAESA